MATITGINIQDMVRHWLSTPEGAYLGSSYGSNIKELLQRPQADGMADAVIRKMKADIPILQSLPSGSINIYRITTTPDRLDLMIEVAGQAIEVTQPQSVAWAGAEPINSDEFWPNSTGELIDSGTVGFWSSVLPVYRMNVQRGPDGQVLSYAPSLSTGPVILDWSRSGGLDDEFLPSLTGGPNDANPSSNEWALSLPYVQSGILTLQAAGSRARISVALGIDVYADIGYEVIWT